MCNCDDIPLARTTGGCSFSFTMILMKKKEQHYSEVGWCFVRVRACALVTSPIGTHNSDVFPQENLPQPKTMSTNSKMLEQYSRDTGIPLRQRTEDDRNEDKLTYAWNQFCNDNACPHIIKLNFNRDGTRKSTVARGWCKTNACICSDECYESTNSYLDYMENILDESNRPVPTFRPENILGAIDARNRTNMVPTVSASDVGSPSLMSCNPTSCMCCELCVTRTNRFLDSQELILNDIQRAKPDSQPGYDPAVLMSQRNACEDDCACSTCIPGYNPADFLSDSEESYEYSEHCTPLSSMICSGQTVMESDQRTITEPSAPCTPCFSQSTVISSAADSNGYAADEEHSESDEDDSDEGSVILGATPLHNSSPVPTIPVVGTRKRKLCAAEQFKNKRACARSFGW